MKDQGYGKNYQYSHQGDGNFIEQEYLPEKLAGITFYIPGKNARGRGNAEIFAGTLEGEIWILN